MAVMKCSLFLGSCVAAPSRVRSQLRARRAMLAFAFLLGAMPHASARALAHDDHDCVPPSAQALVRAAIETNRVALGLPKPPVVVGDPYDGGLADGEGGVAAAPMYPFYPHPGVTKGDTICGSFVDLDATASYHDFECRPFTREGHAGTDSAIRSFAEQWIGVPVFAARDGVVVFMNDGEPDENVNGGFLGNLVILDHGDGFESQYWHLKKFSITVSLGQPVIAGQQIGMVGSSGNSFGPHLHFQTMKNGPSGWQVYEPFHGSCNPGASDFDDQASLDSEDLFLYDWGITRTNLFDLPNPWWEPWPKPADPQIATTDDAIYFFWYVYNFPVDCEIRVKFVRPNGSVADDAIWNWGNTELIRSYSNWFGWEVDWLVPMVGTWHLLFYLDGQLMIDAPFEMVETIDPAFNHPPEPITASFVDPHAEPGEVIFCKVPTLGRMEDLDWDVVRYRFVWRLSGAVVRDVVSAAQSDAIPRNSGDCGAVLTCTVTPNDGVVDGAPSMATMAIGGVLGDFNCDDSVNGDDLGTLLGQWGNCPGCAADFNGDGVVDGDDLGSLLGGWTG
ncbi:MAG: hypothetical protein FJ253_05355 [Phycisphaerae bacterium]|nr:hypothetical protein [Phycisphaerae bacterium]